MGAGGGLLAEPETLLQLYESSSLSSQTPRQGGAKSNNLLKQLTLSSPLPAFSQLTL